MTDNEERVAFSEVTEWWNSYYSSTRGDHICSWESLKCRIFHWKHLKAMSDCLAAHNAVNDMRAKLLDADKIVASWSK